MPQDIQKVLDNWQAVLSEMQKGDAHHLYGFFYGTKPICLDGKTLIVQCPDETNAKIMRGKKSVLEEILAVLYEKTFQIDFKVALKNEQEAVTTEDSEKLWDDIGKSFRL